MPSSHRDPTAPPAPPGQSGPPAMASLDLRDVNARIDYDEFGEPVLVVTDGEVTIEFTGGLRGSSMTAALGARQLSTAARDYAETVRSRLHSERPPIDAPASVSGSRAIGR
jgi:Flp pilus assembly CpaF family ATPase